MPTLAYLHFLRDCRLIDAPDAPFTRLDTDMFYIKETRLRPHSDSLAPVPLRKAPLQSDRCACVCGYVLVI